MKCIIVTSLTSKLHSLKEILHGVLSEVEVESDVACWQHGALIREGVASSRDPLHGAEVDTNDEGLGTRAHLGAGGLGVLVVEAPAAQLESSIHQSGFAHGDGVGDADVVGITDGVNGRFGSRGGSGRQSE